MISIHALLAESDFNGREAFAALLYFYPRSPCGERLCIPNLFLAQENFYPRSPCGERHGSYHGGIDTVHISIHALLAESDSIFNLGGQDINVFLSTLSLRRATAHDAKGPGRVFDFYPRSPCGERPQDLIAKELTLAFLSTLSLRRATLSGTSPASMRKISIHALLAESDQ